MFEFTLWDYREDAKVRGMAALNIHSKYSEISFANNSKGEHLLGQTR